MKSKQPKIGRPKKEGEKFVYFHASVTKEQKAMLESNPGEGSRIVREAIRMHGAGKRMLEALDRIDDMIDEGLGEWAGIHIEHLPEDLWRFKEAQLEARAAIAEFEQSQKNTQ